MSSSYEDFGRFIRMDPNEREEAITDLLSDVAEPWMGTPEETLVLGTVGSLRAVLEAANKFAIDQEHGVPAANEYIMGLFAHTYAQQMRNFATLAALSDVRRGMSKSDD